MTTARDFGIVFNAYMKFEEQMIEAEIEEEEEDDGDVEAQIDKLLEFTFRDIPERHKEVKAAKKSNEEVDTAADNEDLRFFRLENLIQRRPFLLSNVILRQNPHNVYEWLNRVQLCEQLVTSSEDESSSYLAIKTFTEAIAAVDPL